MMAKVLIKMVTVPGAFVRGSGGRNRRRYLIWLVSFMDYDLGYIDLEGKTLQPLDNPFGPKLLPL
jgi:hypothetical protein